ncbi:MAG: PTS fructose transporter subunit IIA [Clostridium sp.]|uniref:PTS system mannose-specific EIIAB component n=1 Tax=Clostridium paraputrificum TaxID=29363 RepID=A0A6N3GQ62_9CLOT|nr:PTS fructose transporter subunit IIA [Clostridium sp.]MBS5926562.1 PTS fructose transporter subunit IIA [Clostridium sp.]
MKKILLASHGDLADGIKSAIEIVLGVQENISTICAYKEKDFNLKIRVEEEIQNLAPDDILIVVTDLFGGSVNNEFMNYLENKNVHLITGLNLLLLIELIVNQNNQKVSELIKNAILNSISGIKYCNELSSNSSEDEDF